MNPHLFLQQGKLRLFPINTIIGGVAASLSTKALLATKLGIAQTEIRRFEIIGSDVHANIKSNYGLNANFRGDSSLKFYDDKDSLVTTINGNCLRETGLEWVNLKGVTNLVANCISNNPFLSSAIFPNSLTYGAQVLQNNSACTHVDLSKVESINPTGTITGYFGGLLSCVLLDLRSLKVMSNSPSGNTETYRAGFGNLKFGCEIRVNIAMATNNAGGPQYAFFYAKTARGAIVKFYDDAGNYVSTL